MRQREHSKEFRNVKTLIGNSVTLADPRVDHLKFLFKDASDFYRELVVTRIPPEDVSKSVKVQRHR